MNISTNRLLALAVAGLIALSGNVLAQEGSGSARHWPSKDAVQDSTQGAVAPDNSRVNKRDRSSESVTSDKQSQSSGDVELTRQIRRAINKDESLSTYAHNVKIVTRGGMVTLKGPVRSDQEKATIEAKAVSVAGEGKVTNELEVTPPKDRSR